jgi:uncharacterized OB-fold protein
MAQQIPVVNYLVLGDDPHLVAQECETCGARYFGRRNACASCSGTTFRERRLADEGTLRTFTIVTRSAPGIAVPYVAGVIDCDGTPVRANVVNVDAHPDAIELGMKVRLTTFAIGTDDAGVEGIGFGYEPAA